MNKYSEFLTDSQIEKVAGIHVVSSGINNYFQGTQEVLKESELLDRLDGPAKEDWERQLKLRLESSLVKSESEKKFDDTEFSVLYLALFQVKSSFLEEIKQKVLALNFPSRELNWFKAMIRWIERDEKENEG